MSEHNTSKTHQNIEANLVAEHNMLQTLWLQNIVNAIRKCGSAGWRTNYSVSDVKRELSAGSMLPDCYRICEETKTLTWVEVIVTHRIRVNRAKLMKLLSLTFELSEFDWVLNIFAVDHLGRISLIDFTDVFSGDASITETPVEDFSSPKTLNT